MCECCSEAHIGGDQIGNVRAGKPWNTLLLQQVLVDTEVGIEDGGLIVDIVGGAVRRAVKEKLGEERKVLGSPGVVVVETHEQNNATKISDAAVNQSIQGHPERRAQRGNILPVERDRQETKTFVP